MGMQATVDKAVNSAFSAAGDLVKTITLQNPSTFDEVTEVEVPGSTGTIKVIKLTQAEAEKYFAGMNWRGVAGDVQAIDLTLMANASTATLDPQQGQKVEWDGKWYQLHRINDSNPALLFLMLRAPA